MRANVQPRGDSFRVVIKSGRKVVKRVSGFKTRQEAEEYRTEFNAAETRRKELDRMKLGGPLAINEILWDYEQNYLSTRSIGYQRHAHCRIAAVAKHFGTMDLRRLTPDDILSYVQTRWSTPPKIQKQIVKRPRTPKLARNAKRKKRVGFGTVIGEISLLRSCILRLVEDPNSVLERSPVPGMMKIAKSYASSKKIGPAEIQIYSDREMAVALEFYQRNFPAVYAPLRFMNATGARIGEVLSLRESRINYRVGTATVIWKKRGGTTTRTIAVPRSILDWIPGHIATERARIRRFNNTDPLIFPGRMGGELTSNTFASYLNAAAVELEKTGLPGYSSHAFRHTYASRMLMHLDGKDLKWLADQLGHGIEVLLSTYAHVMPQNRNVDFADTFAFSSDAPVVELASREELGQK